MERIEVKRKIKKAMEFYRAIGFEYVTFKPEDIMNLLNNGELLPESAVSVEGPFQSKSTVDIEDRTEALRKLREEIGDCKRCRLSEKRKNIVFGEGSPQAAIMFIGEGPGREEDDQARPFVGNAGKLLTNLIVKLGMRRKDVYIANIVKCRPPNNRDPEEDEINICRKFVERQIEIIRPRVIVSLGRISAHALTGTKIPISRLRGNFFTFMDIPLMPTFHPAYLLRNTRDKWLTWDDMQKVLAKLKD